MTVLRHIHYSAHLAVSMVLQSVSLSTNIRHLCHKYQGTHTVYMPCAQVHCRNSMPVYACCLFVSKGKAQKTRGATLHMRSHSCCNSNMLTYCSLSLITCLVQDQLVWWLLRHNQQSTHMAHVHRIQVRCGNFRKVGTVHFALTVLLYMCTCAIP